MTIQPLPKTETQVINYLTNATVTQESKNEFIAKVMLQHQKNFQVVEQEGIKLKNKVTELEEKNKELTEVVDVTVKVTKAVSTGSSIIIGAALTPVCAPLGAAFITAGIGIGIHLGVKHACEAADKKQAEKYMKMYGYTYE